MRAYFRIAVAVLALGLVSESGNAQFTRRGILKTLAGADRGLGGGVGKQEFGSLFTLGTLFGLTYSLDDPSTYKVQNNVVVFDDERQAIRPAVFALPSIALVGAPGKSLSAIVPINLNTAGEVNIGVGLSFGFNIRKAAEIGVAAVAIWGNLQRLTPDQQSSFSNGTVLPTNAVRDIRTAKRAGIGIGLYIVPIL